MISFTKRILLLFAIVLVVNIKSIAACSSGTPANTLIQVCNDSGGSSTISVFFKDGTIPLSYILFSLSPPGPVSVPFGAVTVNPSPSLPVGYLYGVQFGLVPDGDYIVRVNCSPSGFINIGGLGISVNSANFLIATPSLLHPDCNPSSGVGNGQIQLTVSNGTAPYTVIWSGSTPIPPGAITVSGGSQTTIANLDAGSYTATITDANGCIISVIVPIPVSTAPNAGSDFQVCGTSATLAGNSIATGE
ncbi:MAG: hypothetical protein ORN54_00480, partial [Cyclobacteriaceae bacterium]|nr:hypothetical protein [Cyclobacteriaceae bacterium]